MVETNEFREAMARLGAAVSIVTTDGSAGKYGMTATAICSVSASPPMLLICINRSSRGSVVIQENGRFCVNVLSADQQSLAQCFSESSRSIPERFAQCDDWTDMENGTPGLMSAITSIACEVDSVMDAGTHCVIFGSVNQILVGQAPSGLAYFNRSYHVLNETSGLQ